MFYEYLLKCLGAGFSSGTLVKNLSTTAGDIGDLGSVPGSGRSPGEGMTIHFSILAWKIPWTEELSRLQSMGLQRIGHN